MHSIMRFTESELLRLIKETINEVENSSNDSPTTIISKSPKLFYSDVKQKTKGKKILLSSIKVSMSDKTDSQITFTTSPKSKPVIILIPFSEESDMGNCPACKKVRDANPNGQVIKIDGKDFGSFGKNRKFQVIAIPVAKKKKAATTYSVNAVNMIKAARMESFRSQVYDDFCPDSDHPSVKNPKTCGGTLTIGFGSTIDKYPELAKYKKGSKRHLSKALATRYVIKHIETDVLPELKRKVSVPLTQNEFDALVVFIYNVGSVGENLTSAINSESPEDIKKYWNQYIYSKGRRMNGLVKRRHEELDLYFKNL